MKRRLGAAIGIAMLALFIATLYSTTMAQGPVVNTVYFFSPTCPRCEEVKKEDFPSFREQFGDQLLILEVNVQLSDGQVLYQEYLTRYNVPQNRFGVPAMIVGDTYYVGSVEIPELFPSKVEERLNAGGVDWPSLPSLPSYLEKYGTDPVEQITVWQRVAQDPVGNSVSIVVLVGMIVSVILTWSAYSRGNLALKSWPEWIIPVMVVVGIGVALYLSFIEITHTEAVCGPLGDCNAVQTSKYASLFGIVPIGVLGIGGFLAIGGAWGLATFGADESRKTAVQTIWWLALLGTIFSIYLTFLEPFVIGATCAWCLTSAVTMTVILWAATPNIVADRHFSTRRRGYRKFRTR